MELPDKKLDLSNEESKWGELRKDNFGYASDEERLEKRGMEDWELVEKIPESQQNVPYWFMAVVVIVLLVGVGLSFPFWGLRPGVEVKWTDWVLEPGILGIACVHHCSHSFRILHGAFVRITYRRKIGF